MTCTRLVCVRYHLIIDGQFNDGGDVNDKYEYAQANDSDDYSDDADFYEYGYNNRYWVMLITNYLSCIWMV